MKDTLLDFGIVCLVCLRTKQKFNSIFNNDSETPEMQIYEKIIRCSNLELPEHLIKKVPHKICTICLRELGTTWRFRKKCEEANKIFQLMIKPDMQAEEMVKMTLEEHKLKLPPGIKVKCVNSMLPLTTQKILTKPTQEKEKRKPSIDQKNLPQLPMSASPKLKEGESATNPHPHTLNLSPSHSNRDGGDDDGDGDGLDFGTMAMCRMNDFISIDDMEAAQNSASTQHIDYVYDDAEYFDDSNGDALSITMSSSRDDIEDLAVIIAEDTKENIMIIEDESTLPMESESVLTTDEIKAFDDNQAEQSKTTNHITNLSKTSATFQSHQLGKAAVQQWETKHQKQNKMPSINDNKQTSHDDDDDEEYKDISTSKCKTSRAKSGTKATAKICDLCGNTYKYQHALNAHMRRHSNERPYSCEVCNKAFVSNVELRRHMRVHTGQKPYGCQFCSRRFSDFGSSKKHERIHTGERPYVCEVCCKGFAYAHVLTEHRRTHTGEKKYPCPQCEIGFTKKIYLQAHVKSKCKKRFPHNRANKEHGHYNVGNNVDIIDGLTGLTNANMDIFHETPFEDGIVGEEDDMRSVFEDNKVLEECIVESEFISDSLDDDCLPHAGHGNNESDEGGSGGSGVYPLVINTEFPEGYNTE